MDPEDDVICVRGGVVDPSKTLRRAKIDEPRLGHPGVSIACGAPGSTLDEIVAAAEIPHGKVRTTTAGRIREAGFPIHRAGRWPHCTVDLSGAADDAGAQRLADCFDEAIPNPRASREEQDP